MLDNNTLHSVLGTSQYYLEDLMNLKAKNFCNNLSWHQTSLNSLFEQIT